MSKLKSKLRGTTLRLLARELNADTDEIVTCCKLFEIDVSPFRPSGEGLPTTWNGPVSAGLAETIREWHREGRLGPRRTKAQFEEDLVAGSAQAAERVTDWEFGHKLAEIIDHLKRAGLDLAKPRTLTLAWRAWEQFVTFKTGYEHWATCGNCQEQFRPTINRPYVHSYVRREALPEKQWRIRETELFLCPACVRDRRSRKGPRRTGG